MDCDDKVKKILKMKLFDPRIKHHISLHDYMDLTVKRMHVIFQEDLINNHMWLGQAKQSRFDELCQNIALLGIFDVSLSVSIVAHLIAGNVVFTQSDATQMNKYHNEIINLHRIYSFCCTEIACGTNLHNIETTVTYDHSQKRLFLHSPTPESCKFWVGNALYAATVGMVLARLIINGCDEGIHWFRVPLRDKEYGTLFSGISVMSCGPQGGIHGSQFAGIRFNQVSLPLDAMMKGYSHISPQGTFLSQYSKPQRFAKAFETFLQERIFPLSGGSLCAAVALYITFKFSQHRAITLEPNYQTLLMQPLFYQRLYPELLKAFSLRILNNIIIEHFKKNWDNKSAHNELKILASLGKYVGSSLGLDILRKCRMMCVSQGYHHYNQIISIQNDCEANITFAGDNSVMSYQIASYIVQLNKFENQNITPTNIAQILEKKIVANCQKRKFTHTEAQVLSYAYALDLIIQEIQQKNILDNEILQELCNSFSHYLSDTAAIYLLNPTIEKINYLIKILAPPSELITAPIVNSDYAKQLTSDIYK